MDDQKNLITAVVIALLLAIGWPFMMKALFPNLVQQPAAKSAPATPTAPRPGTQAANAQASSVPGVTAAAQVPARPINEAQAIAAAPRVPIDTPRLRGSINLDGARIDDLVLVDHRRSVERDAAPVRLFAPAGTQRSFFAGTGWNASGVQVPDASTRWTAPAGARLTPATPVTLTWNNTTGQRFALTVSVDANYMFTLRQSVTNAGGAPVAMRPFAFVTRRGTSPDADTWTIHSGAVGFTGGEMGYINRDEIDEAPSSTLARRSTGGWLGFTDHFWLGAIIPGQGNVVDTAFRRGDGGIYQADFSGAEKVLPAGATRSVSSQLFAGAKETQLLDLYSTTVPRLDRATDWGWFIWFAKPIFYLLDFLFRLFGNFGVAIIGLTVIIKAIMFPIAQKQFRSMAQMRAAQPKIKALQERYKDDKPRQQQEMMKLYKDEKINPLGGCLPIFIQMPIFYALYKCLMLTVEMRHQPFVGWIRDLSAPDPAHILNLFGLLPFTVPPMLGIGVLAILLGLTMWWQFRLNPPAADPIQQQMFSIMPWVLMFVMAPFAAGLLLYWITNNLLTIAQMKFLYARHPGANTPLTPATT